MRRSLEARRKSRSGCHSVESPRDLKSMVYKSSNALGSGSCNLCERPRYIGFLVVVVRTMLPFSDPEDRFFFSVAKSTSFAIFWRKPAAARENHLSPPISNQLRWPPKVVLQKTMFLFCCTSTYGAAASQAICSLSAEQSCYDAWELTGSSSAWIASTGIRMS